MRLDLFGDTIESIQRFDVVWMDLQGAELLALKGMGNLVDHIQVLHTEVVYRELYAGQVLFPDLHAWLLKRKFVQVHHQRAITVPEWFGEAVYVCQSVVSKLGLPAPTWTSHEPR